MAFLPPEQENNLAPTGQTTAQPQGTGTPPPQSGGSAGAGGSAPKAGASPSSGSPTQFGSSASKLGDYLSANAPQIQSQANNVAGSLNNAYGQVSTDINNSAAQFGQQVQGGYTAGDQNLVNNASQNTQQFVQDPNNIAGFQAQYNDQYTGPQSFESTTPYGNIQNEVNSAVSNAGLLNTQAGLQNYFGQQGGNQTQATNTLDALLTQGNPEAKQTVSNAVNQFGNLTPQFQTATQNADQGVSQAQQNADAARGYAQNAINGQNGALTNLNNDVNSQYQTALQNATQQNQALNQYLSGNDVGHYDAGAINPQILSELGITPQQFADLNNQLYNADTSQYMTGHNFGAGSATQNLSNLTGYLQQTDPNQALSAANTATADQYSQAQALQQLLGTLPQGSALDPSQAGLAGTAPTNLNQFDYNAALQNATNTASGARTDAQAQANQLTAQADAAHEASKHKGILNTVKNVVSNPLQVVKDASDPRNAVNVYKQAVQGKTPEGYNPLPDNQELAKLGIKH